MKLAVKIQFVLILFLQIVESGTPVRVTFQANTCGVPDSLNSSSTVQIRGNLLPFTWESNSNGRMTNVSGDQWKYIVYLNSKETLYYNYFTNAKSIISQNDSGWEADISDWGNGKRRLIIGERDTILSVEYINGFKNPATQWEKPFETGKEDTVVSFLRVNMVSFEMFDSSKYKVGVRGSFATSNWGTSIILKPQQPHANVNSRQYRNAKIYMLSVYWKKSFLDSASKEKIMRYKFVIHHKNASNTEDWSLMIDNPDVQYEYAMPKKDTISKLVFYREKEIIEKEKFDTVFVQFGVDMSLSYKNKSFSMTDTLLVKYGFSPFEWSDSVVLKKIVNSPMLYNHKVKAIAAVKPFGKTLYYKYYIREQGKDYKEMYFHYQSKDSIKYLKPYRTLILPSNKNELFVQRDTAHSIIVQDRSPVNFTISRTLNRNVTLTITTDLRPAYYTLLSGLPIYDAQDIFKNILPSHVDSLSQWGLWINGTIVGGWDNLNGGQWGDGLKYNISKKMYDDGSHGDVVANDSVYTIVVKLFKDSVNNGTGHTVKFGINGGDNEHGKTGDEYDLNYRFLSVNDDDSISTIHTQFGEINPFYYKVWNYDWQTIKTPTLIVCFPQVPLQYNLSQNYPNPFNPSTMINYQLQTNNLVTLKVFDIVGREVTTLVNERQEAGAYQTTFNAQGLSSGLYFYQLRAGNYSEVKKMILMK